jgi:hypothetical protein
VNFAIINNFLTYLHGFYDIYKVSAGPGWAKNKGCPYIK